MKKSLKRSALGKDVRTLSVQILAKFVKIKNTRKINPFIINGGGR